MSDMPRRRLLDKLGGNPSLLAQHARIVGDIETDGALLVSGHVRGDGRIGGELSLGVQAHWEGQVRARRAVIAGRITGSISVEEKIEIGAGAVIQGRVSARLVAIARGARVEGDIVVTGGTAVIEFEEKRAATL